MKRTGLKLAATCAAALLLAADASAFTIEKKQGDMNTKLKIYGFSQLEARGGEGAVGKDNAIKFGAQRIRIGMNYTAGKVGGKLFLDFNQKHDVSKVGMVDMMKDAFVFYKMDKALTFKLGLIKMPHGMGFTIPGWNLDIAERSFDKQMSLERNVGLMLSGRAIAGEGKVNGFEMGHERPWKGWGYDLMIANPAGRSGAVLAGDETPATGYSANKPGKSNSYAARVMYDWTEAFHAEVAYAVSPYAGGVMLDTDGSVDSSNSSEDYTSLNIGIDSHLGATNLKFEMFDSNNIRGEKDFKQTTMAFTGTYALNENWELAAKHVMGSAERVGKQSADITNTYLGFNLFLEPYSKKMTRSSKRKRNAHKLVFNYVIAGGDTDEYATDYKALKAKTDDLWIAQYQYKF